MCAMGSDRDRSNVPLGRLRSESFRSVTLHEAQGSSRACVHEASDSREGNGRAEHGADHS
jgi:hypothetical protein